MRRSVVPRQARWSSISQRSFLQSCVWAERRADEASRDFGAENGAVVVLQQRLPARGLVIEGVVAALPETFSLISASRRLIQRGGRDLFARSRHSSSPGRSARTSRRRRAPRKYQCLAVLKCGDASGDAGLLRQRSDVLASKVRCCWRVPGNTGLPLPSSRSLSGVMVSRPDRPQDRTTVASACGPAANAESNSRRSNSSRHVKLPVSGSASRLVFGNFGAGAT